MQRLQQRFFAPIDISWLVLFRIVFGVCMFVDVCRFFHHGWVSDLAAPGFRFTYYGFDWVRPWPGWGMHAHFAVLGLAALSIAAGFCHRVMATVFFLGFTHVFLIDETRYLNHFYLICLISFLLIFLPANRAWSVDAWLRPAIRSSVTPAWTLWLMRAQIGIPYFFGGIAKLNSDWLQGEPMRMWLAERAHKPFIGPYVHEEWFVYFFVLGGVLLDLFVVPALLWRRTRVLAFVSAVMFHLLNTFLFRIGIFPWLMLGATLIFFPPDTIRRMWPFRRQPVDPPSTAAPSLHSPWQRFTVVAVIFYLIFQVLMPFRHLLYPGNVNWTEEGHRFSWRMKLRSKLGDAHFFLTSPSRGEKWLVNAVSELHDSAYEKMSTHPGMILEYAHYLADQKRREGYHDIEVRAEAMVSLNGRPRQPLIDSKMDLAKEPRSLAHAPWILPLHEPLRRPQ